MFVPRRRESGKVAVRMDENLVLWLICDGKPGHENQSLGLAEAVRRKVPAEIHRIDPSGAGNPLARLRVAGASAASLPRPDCIIAAGHSTHLTLLWLARKYRTKSVVLMRPSLPFSWFDLCIAPEHDFPKPCGSPNVITTRGALNRILPADGERTGKLILIGGPSNNHGWDADALLEMLARATDRGGWELTDSRRTPQGFLEEAARRLPGVSVISHTRTPMGWVPEKLSQAREVWVTEDSVSMVYEALTSGARVGLLPVPRLHPGSRVLRGLESLIADGYLTTYADWQETMRLKTAPQPLREADRCADILLRRIHSKAPSQTSP